MEDRQEADEGAGITREKIRIEYEPCLHALIDDYEDEEDKLKFLKQVLFTLLQVWDFLLD